MVGGLFFCDSSKRLLWVWNAKENKGELWQNHDASIGTAAVGKKARLWTK